MKKIYIILTTIFIITAIITLITYNFIIIPYEAKPELKLNGNDSITIEYNDKYVEDGYKAILNAKDVKDKVIVESNVDCTKVGTYTIKYSITNNKGKHKVVKSRKVSVIDKDMPTIELIGMKDIILYVGDTYNELGYKAFDKYDGDITNNVIKDGVVDTSSAGTYVITYKVKDSSNNETTINRNIKVIDKPKVITSKSGIPILMYHFFYDSSIGEIAKDSNYLEIGKFEEQIKYLVNNNYYFPTWEELNNYIDSKISLPSKSIIITVDDGAESFFRLAYKVLQKYNAKATSFIVTSWTNPNSTGVDRTLINFQSHTNDMHRGGCKTGHGGIMQCIDYNAAVSDLKASTDFIGNSDVIAYPFGDYNDTVIKEVKEAGFKLAVTTSNGKVGVGANKYALPRVRINSSTTLDNFIYLIK